MIDEGVVLKAVDISPYPAMEIDTPEDLELAGQWKVDEDNVFVSKFYKIR